ncbi:hypothetical protein N7493_010995 [Penicillium malachiteum]|uniref:Swiss Army Knife RNA repair protein HAD domain-containing protein n=1 Tax=Penicillium malachiteum TaxID=1324776 RepID=A0AAD6HBF8_9EURO|nr:hypothetical protein N7493_010995 [Penicillium malachiteum]
MRSAKAVVSEKLTRNGKLAQKMSYATSAGAQHTLTGLKRWSVASRELPAVSQVKAIHVYDFDNTLFQSPLPNPQIWHGTTIGHLQSETHFANGGWWHDPNILSATGQGMEKEEPRAWQGWWNENIMRLVRLSMEQKDAVTVLLTGRNEAGFADVVKRMVASQKLDFDMICLKPDVGPNGHRFPSTGVFKHTFLEDLIFTYDEAEEIRVYEDRPKHVKGFRDYLENMNRSLQASADTRKPITAEVIQVSEESTYLDPVTEVSEVQRMINSHNSATQNPSLAKYKGFHRYMRIKRTVIYTGYLISQEDSQRIIDEVLAPILPNGLSEDVKLMANNVLITPRPAPNAVLNQVGGLGKKLKWQVTGTAVSENRIFAARVEPIPSTEQVYSENPVPLIVLAIRKGARPVEASRITNWEPATPSQTLTFDTVVGEKVVLRVEDDDKAGGPPLAPKNFKKRFHQDYEDDAPNPKMAHGGNYENQDHSFHPYQQRPSRDYQGHNEENGSRRGAYRGRGRGRGRGPYRGRGRGRGGRDREGGSNPYYKSLDDYGNNPYEGSHENKGGHGGGGFQMDY